MRLFFALFAIAAAASAHAETLSIIENYTVVKRDSVENVTDNWSQFGLGKRFGVFSWAQTNKTRSNASPYSQAYGGGYFKNSWLQIGIGAGAEQADSKARLGSFLYANRGKSSVFAIYENGGSGYWYLVQPKYQLTKNVSVGTHHQAYVGHGIRAEQNIVVNGNWTTSVWSSALWSGTTGTRPTVMAGLKLSYYKGE